jgi:hypothetical protein
MTKILTVVALLGVFSCFGQGMGISFNSKDIVRMDLWIFGVSPQVNSEQTDTSHLNEELKVAIDKINL